MECRPLIAILRGINPKESEKFSEALIDCGIKIIEVPLNSPSPFDTIYRMINFHGDRAIFGAGTVLNHKDVEKLHDIGCKMIVSPNTNKNVIKKTKQLKMISIPGVFTATEVYNALDYGADFLKLFPANQIKENGFKALFSILPNDLISFAVGGIEKKNLRSWLNVGITGFGIGSYLYEPGISINEFKKKAKKIVQEFDFLSKKRKIKLLKNN